VNRAEESVGIQAEWGGRAQWQARLVIPVLIAAAATVLVLIAVVAGSKSAWLLLGAGRGFVPEEYYHVSAFLILLGTLFGQAVRWAGGSGIAFYVLTRLGFRSNWTTWRIAMSLVYLGLGGLPLLVYHIFYGQWLLGIPRVGLDEWLTANYPDARWLLITAHPIVDLSLVPLTVVFLGVLWGAGERVQRSLALQTVLALALLGTSLAGTLSLGIHSTLVHIRL